MDRALTQAFDGAIAAHRETLARSSAQIELAAEAMAGAIARGGKILIFGNGGSAADAQHLAADLVGRFMRERRAIPAIALTTDTSIVTAVANDYSFDRVFVRQIEALGREGDVAVGISTSGRSANVLAAFERARQQRLTTIALVGATPAPADVCITVAATVTARIQEVHRTIIHVWCEILERGL